MPGQSKPGVGPRSCQCSGLDHLDDEMQVCRDHLSTSVKSEKRKQRNGKNHDSARGSATLRQSCPSPSSSVAQVTFSAAATPAKPPDAAGGGHCQVCLLLLSHYFLLGCQDRQDFPLALVLLTHAKPLPPPSPSASCAPSHHLLLRCFGFLTATSTTTHASVVQSWRALSPLDSLLPIDPFRGTHEGEGPDFLILT